MKSIPGLSLEQMICVNSLDGLASLYVERGYRPEITDDQIDYAIIHSKMLRDRRWSDVLNAVCRVPPSGRTLKVSYRRTGGKFIILTAYWLD